MACPYDKELIDWMNYWDAWHKWASQKISLKHPIKYIKWLLSEPKFWNLFKENKYDRLQKHSRTHR